ncbi:unnamed protein product [Cyprideis torosa]|uniref:SV2A/B/C luminal domain-containing protein n=1 Tax=Cyprideis torosa TaxID=163714 RepID=A0A7R8WI41_9CRUS|nr:unnamed protein product [Cyprideis torosa]CAG0893701.1 unnamed protein product [Cyprideis torosa]
MAADGADLLTPNTSLENLNIGASVIENEKEHFSSWREFLLVCSIPSFLSVIGLIFMPESPRYLLENRKETQAMEVYQHIFKMNHRGDPTARYTLTEMELPKKSLPPGFHSAASTTGILDTIFDGIDGFWASVLGLFAIQYRKTTQVLMIIWLTSAFGYYGLSLWFPEYMKLLKSEEFYRNQTTIKSKNYLGQQFTGDITNTRYVNCQFMESEFKALILNHVLFDNCSFINVDFKDIHSSKTFFRNSFIQNSHFTDTDFYDFRFQNTNKVNTTNVALMVGCQLDFDFNIQLEEVFHEHLFGQLALIPGTIVSLFLLDKFGRVHVLAGSLFLSSVTAFFIWFLSTKVSVIIFEVIFNFIFIAGWNAVDIATVEYYPAHLRTTGYGLLSAVCRTGAIFGSISFASFIGSSRAVPMLATAAVLLAGAIASLKMTETRDILLCSSIPPLTSAPLQLTIFVQ